MIEKENDQKQKNDREAKLTSLIVKMQKIFSDDHPNECLFLLGRINDHLFRSFVANSDEDASTLYMNTIVSALKSVKAKDQRAFHSLYGALATVVLGFTPEDETCLHVVQSLSAIVQSKTVEEINEANYAERTLALSRAKYFRLLYEDLAQAVLSSKFDVALQTVIDSNEQSIKEYNEMMREDKRMTATLSKWLDDEEAHIQKIRNLSKAMAIQKQANKIGHKGNPENNLLN